MFPQFILGAVHNTVSAVFKISRQFSSLVKRVIGITGLSPPQTAVAARSLPKGASSGQFLYWTLNESDHLPHSSVKQSPMSFREVWLIAQLC